MRRNGWRLMLLPALWLGVATLPALADALNSSGDGSGADNPDLMRPASYCSADCGAPGSSDPIDLYAPPQVIDQGDRLVPGLAGLDGVPAESAAPWFETDWSIRLRGSYIEGSEGVDALVRVEPEFSLIHNSRGGQFTLETSAELNVDRNETARIGGLDVSVNQTLALDPTSNLSVSGDLSISQQSVNDPGVGTDVVATPVEIEGTAALGIDRQFGQLGLSASIDSSRVLVSDTQLSGGMESNRDQQYWSNGATLRAGYAITPILTPFVEASAHYLQFDEAPVSTAILLDGWDLEASAGVAANWQDVLNAEASIGYGVRKFRNLSLPELTSVVYALDLTYTPDEAIALGANVSTSLNPGDPDAALPPSVTYAAGADVSYALNSWLTLRGSLSGDVTEPETGTARTVNYGGGVGADVALTDNSSLSLDYGYDESHTFGQPVEYAHEIALGLMFSR